MGEADEKIIERVLTGDRNAYAILVDKYKDRVFSLVVGIVRNRELAEELAQDIFVKAFTSLNKFRKDSSFSTWIYRIAYNTSISETRKRKYTSRSFDEQMERAASLELNDEERTENSESKQALLTSALEKLHSEEKLILMLYYFEEKSVQEISKSSGLSQSNVKVKLFRIRGKLKELMERIGNAELAIY